MCVCVWRINSATCFRTSFLSLVCAFTKQRNDNSEYVYKRGRAVGGAKRTVSQPMPPPAPSDSATQRRTWLRCSEWRMCCDSNLCTDVEHRASAFLKIVEMSDMVQLTYARFDSRTRTAVESWRPGILRVDSMCLIIALCVSRTSMNNE